MSPIKAGLIFLGAACTSLFFGVKIIILGLSGFRNARYPLSTNRDLTGGWARLVASVIILFGAVTCLCGVSTLIFGFLRVRQMVE